MRQLLNTRRRKALATLAVCSVAGITGLVFAQFLSDVQGGASGSIAGLQEITFTAGPAPTDKPLRPGEGVLGDASVTITSPDAIAGLELYEVRDAPGNFTVEGIGDVGASPPLFVNEHLLASAIPINQGIGDVRVPNVFGGSTLVPAAWRGKNFTKQITLRFRAP